MSDARIVTILFTDLVGSTQLADRHGDQAAEQVRRAHFGLLRDALAEHAGQEVKSVGDGQMAVFPSAVDAVACATDFQRAVDRHNRRPGTTHQLEVRVGLHVGEPIREGDDYYGSTVNVASRLCNAANGGQILASDLVRALTRTQAAAEFRRLDAIELKGVEEPVEPYEVIWSPATEAELPLPPALTTATRSPFVGRDAAFESLQVEWKRASSGERRTVLIAGEPGIGKTRLARELTHQAHEDGAIVLFGRCDEDALVPYQPFVEALRFYVSVCARGDLVDQLGEAAADLTRLVPEIGDRISGLPPAESVDPEAERYRLFRAVARVLTEAARNAPLLLILDDLHWADRPTLALLRHVLRDPAPAPLLVCGTYRDTDLDRKHPFAETLADLRRENAYERVLLRGLSHEEIIAMLEVAAAQKMDPAGLALAEALETETEGNPFFIEEIVLHLVETGTIYREGDRWVSGARSPAQLDIPEGIREAVGRRLSRLSDDANEALAQASVLGPRFEYAALRVMSDMDDARLSRALEEARNIQLLLEAELDARPAFMFAHALVRQVLYEELSLPRRQQLHLKAAEALVTTHPSDTPLGSIAAHYRAAGAAADPQKAIDYSLLAGQKAVTVFAFEEALKHLEAARELMEEQGTDADVRARLLRYLGDLHFTTGIDYDKGITELEQGLGLYEELADNVRAAQMHARLGRAFSTFGGSGRTDIPRALEHFRTAESALSGHPATAATGYTNVGLAAAALWAVNNAEGLESSARGMEIGEQLGLEILWASAAALHGWHLCADGHPDRGLELLERAYEAADRLENGPAAFFAVWMRSFLAIFLGNPRVAAEWLDRELTKPRLAEAPNLRYLLTSQHAFASWFTGDTSGFRRLAETGDARATDNLNLALHDGDFEGYKQSDHKARDEFARSGNRFQLGASLNFDGGFLYYAGELAAAEKSWLASVQIPHRFAEVWNRCGLAGVYMRTGRPAETMQQAERLHEITDTDDDWQGIVGMAACIDAVAASARGDFDKADEGFATAVRVAREYGTVRMELWALYDWAFARKLAGDAAGANEKLDELGALYRRHDLGQWWFDRLEAERP
jgi:class 3 adenylate cyclase/tetratricopeptide (TPR) repeat protein